MAELFLANRKEWKAMNYRWEIPYSNFVGNKKRITT